MILGGGISGLYSAYTLLQKNPVEKIILLEKSSEWGGRVYTDNKLMVEAGAARFNHEHKHIFQLLEDFHLTGDIVPISNELRIAEYPNQTLSSIILKLGVFKTVDFTHDMTKYTLEEYVKLILSEQEVQFLKDSMGYYSELVIMNAKDAIHLLSHMDQPFFCLEHGLSQIIQELVRRIKLYPSCILKLNEEVLSVKRGKNGYTIKSSKEVYTVPWCICTLEKNIVDKFSLDIHNLHYLANSPLCRIFCTFATPWYKSMPKYTTKTPLRIIIPHNKCIQISYSDHKYALFWKQVYDTYGVPGVNRALTHFIKEALNINMPPPTSTDVHFWDYGVSYWTKGADSERLSKYFQEPLPQFYLCSDAYCSEFQQWMEGGLCMSQEACNRIMARRPEPKVQS